MAPLGGPFTFRALATLAAALALGVVFHGDTAEARSDSARELHVSPHGRDSWPGTKQRPFATLQRAQSRVRQLTRHMDEDVVVNLRAGVHKLSKPLRLREAAGDSGRNGHRVIYQAYRYGTPAQEDVTVSGGRQIGDWRPFRDGIWRAKARDVDTRQLYVNGRRAKRAALDAPLPGMFEETDLGYSTESRIPPSWSNPEDIEFVYTGAYVWTEGYCGVDDVERDAQSTRVVMDQPCYGWAKHIYSIPWTGKPAGLIDPTSIENSLSFLDQPGEWYLDRREEVLYYKPLPGESMRRVEVIAPVLETLVDGRGEPGSPLHDVSFRGLTFSHATWLAPNGPKGFLQIAWSMYYDGGEVCACPEDPFPTAEDNVTMPGNLWFHHSDRIAFEGNRFVHLGGEALQFTSDSSQNVIQGNEFTDVSAGGIGIGVMAPVLTGDYNGNRIEDNWVHEVGVEYKGTIGINVQLTQDTVVAHNQVNDLPYSGIVFEGPDFGDPTTTRQHVLNNRVFNTMNVLRDGGGIYTYGFQGTSYEDGAQIRGNVVHDTNQGYNNGIYVDVGPNWVTVEENVVYRNEHAFGGAFLTDVIVTRNFWDDDEPSYVWNVPERVMIEDNTLLPRDGFEAECAAITACTEIVANAGPRPSYRARLGLE